MFWLFEIGSFWHSVKYCVKPDVCEKNPCLEQEGQVTGKSPTIAQVISYCVQASSNSTEILSTLAAYLIQNKVEIMDSRDSPKTLPHFKHEQSKLTNALARYSTTGKACFISSLSPMLSVSFCPGFLCSTGKCFIVTTRHLNGGIMGKPFLVLPITVVRSQRRSVIQPSNIMNELNNFICIDTVSVLA